jgi:hypothetical protein
MELIQRTIATLQEGHFRIKAQHEEELTRLRTQTAAAAAARSTSGDSGDAHSGAAVVLPARNVPPRSTLPLEGGLGGGRDYGNSSSGAGADNTNSNWQPPHELAAQHMRGSIGSNSSGGGLQQMPSMQLQSMLSNNNNNNNNNSGTNSSNSGQPAAKRSRAEDYSHQNVDADRGGMGMRDDRGGIIPSSNYSNSNNSNRQPPGAAGNSGNYRSEQQQQHDDMHSDRRDANSSSGASRGLQQRQQQSDVMHRSSNSSHDRPRSNSSNTVISSMNSSSGNSGSSRPTAAADDMMQPQSPQQQQQHAEQLSTATGTAASAPPHELVRHTPAPRPPFVTPAWTLEYVAGRDGLRPTVELASCLSLGSVVCCVRFSRDGTRIATGSHGCVKVFDVATGTEVFEHKKALSAADADAVSYTTYALLNNW